MAAITVIQFKAQMDSIAAQKALRDAACTEAPGAATAGTVAKGASNNYDRIDAYSDDPDLQVQLLGPARQNFLIANADAQAGNWAKPLILAINQNVGGISNFITANSARIAPQAAKAYYACGFPTLSYLSVFSPTVDPMATFTVGGAFADGAQLDKTKYAPQMLTLYVDTVSGGGLTLAAGTYHVSCKKYDGTVEVKDVVVPMGTAAAAEFDVGIATDLYWDVTLIAVTDGTAGDVVKIRAKQERPTGTGAL